jgi:hypothetical protein
MKSKLTLSLPEKTIQEAKKIAADRNTTVSALFSESMKLFRQIEMSPDTSPSSNGMEDLLGVFDAQVAFDQKSARIREKHG